MGEKGKGWVLSSYLAQFQERKSVCNLMFGGCRDPNRARTSAYCKEEVVNCNRIVLCVSVALPLTLNALVPGCCCLDAGFRWSVAIVNGSAKMKLKRRNDHFFVSDKYLWLSTRFTKCSIVISKIWADQTADYPTVIDLVLYYLPTHMYTSVHPSPSKTKFLKFTAFWTQNYSNATWDTVCIE